MGIETGETGLNTADDARVASAAQQRAAAGRLAGWLYMLGALLLVPSTLLVEPAPGFELYALTAVGALTGLAWIHTPWERLPPASLHAPPVIGAIEIGLVLWALGEEGHVYVAMLVILAVWTGYVVTDRRAVGAHITFSMVVATAALALNDPFGREMSLHLLVWFPVVVVAAVFVTFAREHADARADAFRRLAERDPLTGVGNYRALRERLEYEVVRHGRRGRPLAVLVLDLDGFKGVNDRHGHLAGDDVLRRVAEELAQAVRGEDTVVRHGGDEFAVLAPELGPDDLPALAERIAERVAAVNLGSERIGATVGWASFPAHGISPDELLARADAALRERKRRSVVSD